MNRRDFLKVLRDTSVVVPVVAIVGNLPAVESSAMPPQIAWEWVNASESNRKWRIGSTVYPTHGTAYVTQGTAEMWNPVTQEFYTP